MTDREDDLKATAEAMIDDSQRVMDLEQQKLALDAKDPRYGKLSRAIERVVARMKTKARAQTEMADEARQE